MILYVKETAQFSVSNIRPWVKNTFSILPLNSLTHVSNNDIIILSAYDNSSIPNIDNYNYIIYEDAFEKLSASIVQEYEYNHDYYYIKYALDQAAAPTTTTLFSGSSYGAFGIIPSLFDNAVNLSSISQDLYYSINLVYAAYKKNNSIENVILPMQYYYFYTDLSKTQNHDEQTRISKVYYPLLNDSHNCVLFPPKQNFLYESDIFDVHSILNTYAYGEYQKGFFNNDRPRINYATKVWTDQSKDWSTLTEAEKYAAGKVRANQHNECQKYKKTLFENKNIFQNFVNFCNAKNINLLIVVTPTTPYYSNELSSNYKKDFYNILNNTEGIIHLIDLSDSDAFSDIDFNDTDHLNRDGAIKLSTILLDTLQEITN